MKSFIYIVITVIGIMAVYSFSTPKVNFTIDSEDGIQFYKGTWEDALQLAKKENKLVFLDIYATWCGPCKKLKKNTFSSDEVGLFYNQNFINVAFDGEEKIGRMLMKKYKLRSFPSLLFIDGDGKVVEKTVGYHNPKQLIQLGQKIKNKS